MAIHKLTAPDDRQVSIIGSESDASRRCWVVFGTGYTTADNVAEYAQRAGYEVEEVDAVPDDYTTAVGRLNAYPILQSGGLVDGADPESVYMRVAPDGHTRVDVRRIIAGERDVRAHRE